MKLPPLAIVKRTPRTNCGCCGHPTCLAFGAAVVKTGYALSRCPFIDLTGLDLDPTPVAAAPNQEARDLAFIATLKERVAPFDLQALAPQLGASWEPGHPDTLSFRYLGHTVTLSKNTLLLDGQEPDDPRDQILIYNYLYGRGTQRPSGEWIGMESLPNSISKIKTLATYCEAPLARLFSEQPRSTLRPALLALDAVAADNPSADLAVVVPVLPMVPQCLLFWGAAPEERFEARVKILFDRHVLSYLDLESLVFSSERLAERLATLVNR